MTKKFLKSPLFLVVITAIVITFLVFLAYQTQWKYHLEVDVWGFYYPRFKYFVENLSFEKIPGNEYFPGAMFFFLLPGISILFGPDNSSTYLVGLFVINIILVSLHLYIYRKFNLFSPFIFLIILLFAGPIFLFRHDLYVSLVVLISLLLWKNHKKHLALIVLGIATSIKIYPILILPYYLILEKESLKKIFNKLLFFTLGASIFPVLYTLAGAKIQDLIEPLTINSIKPVHVESVWGSFLTFGSKIFSGTWALGKGAHGIFGIDPSFIVFPLSFYNYFWLIPIGVFYIYLYKKRDRLGFKLEIPFLLILLFEIFSKILTGQYLFWFLPLFPLFWTNKPNFKILTSFSYIVLTVFITQIIYPLHYNELLGIFYTIGKDQIYFYLLFMRNLFLILLFVIIFKTLNDQENKT